MKYVAMDAYFIQTILNTHHTELCIFLTVISLQ